MKVTVHAPDKSVQLVGNHAGAPLKVIVPDAAVWYDPSTLETVIVHASDTPTIAAMQEMEIAVLV